MAREIVMYLDQKGAKVMQIIDRTVMADGTKIQLEDWHSENSEKYINLHGYTIGAYPIAKNTSRFGWIRKGETFRLGIARNEYANYTDDMVLADYEALKNGTKSLADLREHFWNREKDAFYLGLADKEPEWQLNEILVSLSENNKADAEMYLSYLLGRRM